MYDSCVYSFSKRFGMVESVMSKKSEVLKKENDSEAKLAMIEHENGKLKDMVLGCEQVSTEHKELIEALKKDLKHKGRLEDFYSDFKDKLAEAEEQFPLAQMGVLTPGSAHARPSARPPIDISGKFPAHMSAESLF
jgi:hypothetical protein